MAKVTSKNQVTLPKIITDRYGITAGDIIEFVPDGEAIRLELVGTSRGADTAHRLARFDAATARQQARDKAKKWRPTKDRGWRRDDLYDRAGTR